MTAIERFNLTWLANAMTDAPNSNRQYYYDIKNQNFFSMKYPALPDEGIELLNALGFAITGDAYVELFTRLLNLNGTPDGIIEIYRLGYAQKTDIQWQFLNRFVGHTYPHNYFSAVINQKEEDSFVLDNIIGKPGNEHLYSLWEIFKLEVIRIYAHNFEKSTGVKLDLLS